MPDRDVEIGNQLFGINAFYCKIKIYSLIVFTVKSNMLVGQFRIILCQRIGIARYQTPNALEQYHTVVSGFSSKLTSLP